MQRKITILVILILVFNINQIKCGQIDSIKHIDSFVIECGFFREIIDARILASNMTFKIIFSFGEGEQRTLHSLELKKRLLSYLNQFYIKKTEKIDFGINGEEELIADFPVITFIGFKDGEEKIKQSTTLSSHIKFNPKFLEFYHFLKSLLREPFR